MAIAAPEPVETPPLSMAPGLGTIGGAPTDADSQAKPADPPAPAAKTPAKDADPQYPGSIPVGPKPEARKDPDYPGAIPVDQPKQSAPPQYPGATIPGSPPPVAVPAPTPAFTPPEAAQPSISPPPPANLPAPQAQPPVPTPTPESSAPDPHELQQVLKAQGISPGAAQAVAAGQIPKTISGNIPAPPKPQPSPAPADETQPDKSSTASGEIPGDTDTAPPAATSIAPSAPAKPAATTPITPQAAKAFVLSTIPKSDTQSIAGVNQMFQKGQLQTREDGSIWWQQPDGTATQIANSASDIQGGKPSTTSTAPAAPSASTTDEPKTVVGDGMLKGTATSFGLNYDGSYDKDDNGIGFFGGVNTRNPKLKAVAVPVDVLETAFGKFTKKLPDGTYAPLDTPEAQKIIQAIRSAHVEAQGLDGKIHSFPIVDIQGSLGGHPGKVLDMTPAAGRELGFNDNHSVSYQIVGGDGKPYAIPADQLAGWNSGGGKSDSGKSGGKSSDPFAGQPLFSIPVAGSGGSESRPPSPQASSFGGGGGGSSQAAPQGDSGGSGGAGAFLGGAAAGALVANAMSGRGQQQSQPVDSSASTNPMVQALINRGFTPQQAQLYAQGVQNIAPGKGIGPLQVGAPPPAPSAPAQLPSTQLNIRPQQGVTPKLLAPKQLMPGKVPKIVPGPPPAAPGAPAAQAGPSQAVDPSVVLGLIKRGFTREQALAFAGKATVSQASPVTGAANFRPPQSSAKTPAISASTPQQQAPARQPQAAQAPPPPAPPPKDQPKPKAQPVQAEPTEFTGRPAGSTHGDPNPPGMEELSGSLKDQGAQHAGLLSGDDPRVKKQKDGYIKGEHFVEGDPYHDQLLNGLPYGKQGRQRGILSQGETAIADKSPMHISYISAPQEAEKFPTRESRKVQYDAHSPEARLMGTTEGQLVGHSMIPLSVGVKLPDKKGEKAGDPHQGYIQGLSTNILANNFQHLNDKLSAMGRKTPYKELGAKFSNDLEGYFHNLLAGHTATGSGYTIGTEDHPNEPDREHVPYMLTRKEADFIGTVINNDAAFSKHEDAKKIRELARANGTLITEKGETNRLQHDIEQHEPGWRKRVLEHAVKTFRAGLVHEILPDEEHMPESIRPGKAYQMLTKALARTSERGRPDIAAGASLHHSFQDNKKINDIERDFSEHRIDEAEARNRIKALGEDPEDYRFIGGSGGLITPYEDDPEAITPEEHTQMKDNLRQQWVGGKMNVEDYRKKAAEVPLPSKPSQAAKPKPVPKAPPAPTAKPEEERIKHAAYRDYDKNVYTGTTHAEIVDRHEEQDLPTDFEEAGFVTNKGRFLNRDEALKLAQKAKQVGQKSGSDARDTELHSSDLKPSAPPSPSLAATAGPVEAPEAPPAPKPLAPKPPKPPKPKAPPSPEPEDTESTEPEKPAETSTGPEETPETPTAPPKKAPAPDEPLPKPAKKPEPAEEAAPAHAFKEVKPEEFIQHRNKSAKPEFLSDLKPEDIKNHKLFTNQDNTIGAAVSPEGDIQNVFNNGGEKGAGAHAVAHAIEHHGGRTLDAYDGFLPKYYRQFGFHETGRTKFNPEFAPKWDTAKHGTPDVVHMGWGGHPEGGPDAAVERAKNRDQTKWIPNERSTHYDDDFDTQKARSQAFARRAKTDRPDGAPGKAKAVPAGKTALPGSGATPGRAVKAPAYGEPLPPVAKKPKAAKPVLEQVSAAPKPTATAALEKPSWKTANEKTRQAYLKQRVAQDLEKQYKGPDAHPLEVDRNDDKSIKYDPSGNPIYKKIDYDLANSPLLKKKGLKQIKEADKHEDTLGNLIGPDGKEVIDPETGKPVLKHAHLNQTERRRLSAMHTASAVHTMGNKIVDEFMKIKDIPEIAAGEGWYSRMRKKLADALGEHHELFAQLLGATSAKTPVRNNFIQSLDALEQYKSGKFDNHVKKYLEGYEKMREGKGALVAHMKSLGIPLYDKDGDTVDTHENDAAAMANWIHHHGILPRQQIQPGQEEGSKYNANSIAVLKALAGTWLKEVGAPKTPNFAGNLTGRTLEATIDVWAARFLKRLGYEGHGPGPWRAQGKSEPGVNSLDFAFSQDAMRHAADEITRRTGKKMNPDDLQAIAWFAEKHHWEKQGWTRGAGAEKSSFDDVADLAFPKTGEPMTSADLRKHYGAIQEEAKRVKARVKTAKNYVGHADPKMRAKLEPYMEKHGLTHEQVHGPEVEEEDEDEAA